MERLKKVNKLIKEELSRIIFKELEFPPSVLVTITDVQTKEDFSEAIIFVSCFPEEKFEEVLKTLKSNIYFLQKKIDEKLVMRKIPKIVFAKETRTQRAAKIEEILYKLKKEKK